MPNNEKKKLRMNFSSRGRENEKITREVREKNGGSERKRTAISRGGEREGIIVSWVSLQEGKWQANAARAE